MINYAEKGVGLHEAIRSAGHWLRQENGAWLSSDDAAVQAVIDAFNPLSAAIDAQKAAIDAIAAQKRNATVGNVSAAEMSKWQEKYRQSKAYKTTPVDTSAPDIASEASARGITTDALATKIIAKGDQLSALEARIAGIGGKHADAVSAMTDWKAVLSYDITIGWP